jgi:hypothetical protein
MSTKLRAHHTTVASQIGLICFLVIGVGHAFRHVMVFLPSGKWGLGIKSSAILLAGLYFVFAAHIQLRAGIIDPNRIERERLTRVIQSGFEKNPDEFLYILSPWNLVNLSNGICAGEFGGVCSSNKINAKWFLEYTFNDIFHTQPKGMKIEFANLWAFQKSISANPLAADAVIIDGNNILSANRSGFTQTPRDVQLESF